MIGALVALAGGLGAVARFLVDGAINARVTGRIPVATLVINVLGSFLLGVLIGWAPAGWPQAQQVLGIGFLGGFTTFSTASVEVARLVRARQPREAAVLGLAMLLTSWAAAVLGLVLTGAW